MHPILKRTLLPSLMAMSLVGGNLVSVQPASAKHRLIKDAGVGAAAGTVTGTVTSRHHTAANAVNGAAAGAAVNAVNHGGRHRSRHLARDTAVGAAAGTVAGVITNRRHPLSNAINGGAAGAATNLLGR
ncbi:MAG: hypothetical protein DSM106950_01675 [Stigonema ocellatum SAG 48.90 = DSM 106950]|nr:hypothetical protein [Stigonema ocellatum SAG 48.90 = DSM 106950]